MLFLKNYFISLTHAVPGMRFWRVAPSVRLSIPNASQFVIIFVHSVIRSFRSFRILCDSLHILCDSLHILCDFSQRLFTFLQHFFVFSKVLLRFCEKQGRIPRPCFHFSISLKICHELELISSLYSSMQMHSSSLCLS